MSKREGQHIDKGRLRLNMVARAWRQGKSLGKLSAARSIAFQSFIKSFPSFGRGFDSHRPLHDSAKFLLIRLPLLTSRLSVCAQAGGVLRPFCAQKYSTRN